MKSEPEPIATLVEGASVWLVTSSEAPGEAMLTFRFDLTAIRAMVAALETPALDERVRGQGRRGGLRLVK